MTLQDNDTGGAARNDNGDNDLETRGLCLLSLDGGGVRGLSTLYILRALMKRLNEQRREANLGRLKPCEIFDLIGGTSTGGIIAIMLGRLEMDVDECIEAYKKLMKTVFEKKQRFFSVGFRGKIKSRFSSKTLEKAMKAVIESREAVTGQKISVDEPFCVENEENGVKKCRVFVCTRTQEMNSVTLLRSYPLVSEHTEPTTIWQAALATSAATTFFDPVQIGDRVYVDGAIGANNPAAEVETEASNIWCEATGQLEPLVKCFISIGTGNRTIDPISDKAWTFLTESLKNVATGTKATEEAVLGRWRLHWNARYFRFNVEHGLQRIGLAEYQHSGPIDAATGQYLASHETRPRLTACVKNLREKKYAPNRQFCVARTASHAQKVIKPQQDSIFTTDTEISELMDQANRNLKKPRDIITHRDLLKAHEDFLRVLHAKRDRSPPAKPKEFANINNKLMSTCLLLSHFLNFTPQERMKYIHDAEKYAKRAEANAIKSQNNDRVVQMEFYLRCVKAREIQLRSTVAEFQRPTQSERDDAEEAILVALVKLRSVDNLDVLPYEVMAKESIGQLR